MCALMMQSLDRQKEPFRSVVYVIHVLKICLIKELPNGVGAYWVHDMI